MRNEEGKSFDICTPSSAVRVMNKWKELDRAFGIHGGDVKCIQLFC
jgi:hypothetical protein